VAFSILSHVVCWVSSSPLLFVCFLLRFSPFDVINNYNCFLVNVELFYNISSSKQGIVNLSFCHYVVWISLISAQ
jgi:hypothetical protein